MNRRILPLFLVPVCALAVACGASADARDSRSSAESNIDPAVPDGGAGGDAGLGIDFSSVPTQIALSQSQGALAVSALATLFYSFFPPGQGLDPTATPAADAAVIAANVQAACATAQVTYPANAAYLTVDFGNACTLTDTNVVVSGVVQIGVTGDGVSVPLAALQIRDVEVAGYTLNGFANVASTAASLSIATRVSAAGVGDIAFNGTSSRADTADAPVVVLSGTGVFTGSKYTTPANSDGVSCVSSVQSFIGFHSVRQTPSQCFAATGSLDVRTSFVCRVAGGPADADFTTTVSFATVKFDSTTATSGAATFSVTVPGRVDDDGTPVTATATLSAADCP